jgi:urease accessory protein
MASSLHRLSPDNEDSPMIALQPIAPAAKAMPPAVTLERVRGEARLAVRAEGGVTRLAENFQSGSAKLRFPKPLPGDAFEVVLLNTAGGVTGGDRLGFTMTAGEDARCLATTQAAERAYRRNDGEARVETRLRVDARANLAWIPQETILFEGSALRRSLSADVAADGTLLAVESIVLGRTAMGERIRSVSLLDSWRIRRAGRLVFADGLRLDGDSVSILENRATGGGAIAMATLVLVSPDAESRIDAAREVTATAAGEAGVSAWNGALVARFVASNSQALRADLIRLIETLRGVTMPRLWHC